MDQYQYNLFRFIKVQRNINILIINPIMRNFRKIVIISQKLKLSRFICYLKIVLLSLYTLLLLLSIK